MERDQITPEGYNKEEEFFYRKNLELIEKARKKLDAERAATRQREQKKSFWMVCPKCGGKLKEVNLKGVVADHCDGCDGIFLDKGEIELIPHARKVRGWLSTITDLFGFEGQSRVETALHRKDVEIIEQARKKLDAERAAVREREQKQTHWMVCPKCGGKLQEVNVKGVVADHCGSCHGVFLDKGEIELIPHARQLEGWESAVRELLE